MLIVRHFPPPVSPSLFAHLDVRGIHPNVTKSCRERQIKMKERRKTLLSSPIRKQFVSI